MSSEVAYVSDSVAALLLAEEHSPHAVIENRDQSFARTNKLESRVRARGGLKKANSGHPDPKSVAEKVLRAFNTWSFKREQPSDSQLLLRVIADAVAAGEPIPFVLYWGKGPRHEAAQPEAQCLNFLGALADRIKGAYAPGATIRLLLTDTHAELNGHRREDIARYFEDIKLEAGKRGFETCWLGNLVKAAGNLATAAPVETEIPAEVLSSLTASAQKWYRGNGSPADGALTYFRLNLIERRVVERAFPQSIFITFNGSELRSLFPQRLPIFYMYSLRRGVAVKPWFLPAEPVTLDGTANQAKTTDRD